jgi:hypothetical protein
VYSNIQFIEEGKPAPCTILAAPIRVRLYEADLNQLVRWGIDPSIFARDLVNTTLEKIIKK